MENTENVQAAPQIEPRSDTAVGSNPWFAKCVEVKLMRDGTIEVHCKKGLWSVSGKDKRTVEFESGRYWWQYFRDGEYKDILANDRGERHA